MVLFFLEILGSLGLLGAKIFWARKQKIGWVFAFFGEMSFFLVYFIHGRHVLSVLEFGVIIAVLYGLYKWGRYGEIRQNSLDILIHIFTLGVVLIVSVFIFRNEGVSLKTLSEALLSLSNMLGVLLLAKKYRLGWIFYMVAHFVCVFYLITYFHFYFASSVQLLSFFIAVWGFLNFKKSSRG